MIFIYIIVENANRELSSRILLILEILKSLTKKSKYSYWRKK